MGRKGILLTLVVTLAIWATTATARDCGTCASLGYDCLPPEKSVRDLCGHIIKPQSCPIPSCPAYCTTIHTDGTWNGTCNSATYKCVCTQQSSSIATTVDEPKPPAATIPQSCTDLAKDYKCIPDGLAAFAPDECPDIIPLCSVQCGSAATGLDLTATCDPSGSGCRCTGSTSLLGGASTGESVLDAVVPLDGNYTTIVVNTNGTLTAGPGLITLFSVSGAAGLAMVIAVLWYVGEKPFGGVVAV